MVCLGKRCPCCGGKKMVNRGKNSWIEGTSLVSPLVCAQCGQRLTSFGLYTKSAEQRRHARYQLPPSFVLRIPGEPPQFSRIHNISQNGICFSNTNCCLAADQTLRVDIFDCNSGTVIEQLPLEIIATSPLARQESDQSSLLLTKGARFLHLTQAQKKLLAGCIQSHGRLDQTKPAESFTLP